MILNQENNPLLAILAIIYTYGKRKINSNKD